MKTLTVRVMRQTKIELGLEHSDRMTIIVLLVVLLSSLAAVCVGVVHARSSDAQLWNLVQEFQGQGISLEYALSQPVHEVTNGDVMTTDNPLRTGYTDTVNCLRSVTGTPADTISMLLQMLTFLVFPLLFLALGASVMTVDWRHGTMMLRGAGASWKMIIGGKMALLGLSSVVAIALVCIVGLLESLILRVSMLKLISGIPYDYSFASEPHPIGGKILISFMSCLVFGVLGMALGALTRSRMWPSLAAAFVLFAVPFLGPWDPRNLVAVLADPVFDPWGPFVLRSPIPVDAQLASGGLIVFGLVCACLPFVLPRQRNRYFRAGS